MKGTGEHRRQKVGIPTVGESDTAEHHNNKDNEVSQVQEHPVRHQGLRALSIESRQLSRSGREGHRKTMRVKIPIFLKIVEKYRSLKAKNSVATLR